MRNRFNILLISFLLVFASSCNKLVPLERASETSSESSNDDSFMLKSGEGDIDVLDTEDGITDTDNDEDHDSDGNITDTDNDEDHDKDNTDKG
tara:strand:+ start:159 stop:437 length:279 start_codon:yes stop_codon:yes gene_type:complete